MSKLAVMAFADGEPMEVSALCAREGVSTKTFYKYVARYRAEGEAGFEPRSRRPNNSPNQTAFEVEDRTNHRILVRRGLVARPDRGWPWRT